MRFSAPANGGGDEGGAGLIGKTWAGFGAGFYGEGFFQGQLFIVKLLRGWGRSFYILFFIFY